MNTTKQRINMDEFDFDKLKYYDESARNPDDSIGGCLGVAFGFVLSLIICIILNCMA